MDLAVIYICVLSLSCPFPNDIKYTQKMFDLALTSLLNPEKLYKIKDRRQGEIFPTDSGLKDNQHIETTARNKKK